MEKNTFQVHEKMIRTAYELAIQPQPQLMPFKLLVKCQRMHGVTLISRKDDNHTISEYPQCIVSTI